MKRFDSDIKTGKSATNEHKWWRLYRAVWYLFDNYLKEDKSCKP